MTVYTLDGRRRGEWREGQQTLDDALRELVRIAGALDELSQQSATRDLLRALATLQRQQIQNLSKAHAYFGATSHVLDDADDLPF